jgi:hypothetical protein
MSESSFARRVLTAGYERLGKRLGVQTSFRDTLFAHFGADPARMPTLTEKLGLHDHANLQLALDGLLAESAHSLMGFHSSMSAYRTATFAGLLSSQTHEAAEHGPVQYASVAVADGAHVSCVAQGLYLVSSTPRIALLVSATSSQYEPSLQVEVMAGDRAAAERVLGDLRRRMHRANVYRGKIVSLSCTPGGGFDISFHAVKPLTRESIILPAALLDRIERQTLGFSERAAQLVDGGQHLKRGLLLHGPPGTGKTLTAMYLAQRMPNRTVILVTGRGMGLIEQAVRFGRLLAPATIVLEDVDLIAQDRTRTEESTGPVLFELLNAMDGLSDDADLLFLLTTNRPDVLEPALAARPGRIDLALEVPVPDEACRRRLIALYAAKLRFEVKDLDAVIRRTEGASAAFLRELVRKAALYAAYESPNLVVRDAHLDEAIQELLAAGGAVTASLLGAPKGA